MGNIRNDCEDCKRMEEKYGKEIKICDRCEHYFRGEKCSCGGYDE